MIQGGFWAGGDMDVKAAGHGSGMNGGLQRQG
jgi:hypothetical protein